MTMRFAYTGVKVSNPAVALHGRPTRPRAMLQITAIGPGGTVVDDGLLDTGADDTVFSESAAVALGIDLAAAASGSAGGVGGHSGTIHYATVKLRITDGKEFREWEAIVGFSIAIRRPLLGFAGFLQFFTATFHGDREEVELAANTLFPAP